MRITALDIRACRVAGETSGLIGGPVEGLEFLVYTLRTECGL